jgi:hypothetical protein
MTKKEEALYHKLQAISIKTQNCANCFSKGNLAHGFLTDIRKDIIAILDDMKFKEVK